MYYTHTYNTCTGRSMKQRQKIAVETGLNFDTDSVTAPARTVENSESGWTRGEVYKRRSFAATPTGPHNFSDIIATYYTGYIIPMHVYMSIIIYSIDKSETRNVHSLCMCCSYCHRNHFCLIVSNRHVLKILATPRLSCTWDT